MKRILMAVLSLALAGTALAQAGSCADEAARTQKVFDYVRLNPVAGARLFKAVYEEEKGKTGTPLAALSAAQEAYFDAVHLEAVGIAQARDAASAPYEAAKVARGYRFRLDQLAAAMPPPQERRARPSVFNHIETKARPRIPAP